MRSLFFARKTATCTRRIPGPRDPPGFPDQIKDSEQLKSSFHLGAGWKAMNTDLSSPRLGDRGFKTVDDLNNWGLHKRLIGEVDVFQVDSTHELYGHMNVNYLRMPARAFFRSLGGRAGGGREGRLLHHDRRGFAAAGRHGGNRRRHHRGGDGLLDIPLAHGGDRLGRRARDASADDSADDTRANSARTSSRGT